MSIYAVLDSNTNICVNVIVLDDINDWTCPESCYLVNNDLALGQIGQTYDPINLEWIPYVPEPIKEPVPKSITRRQCSLELLKRKMITDIEALNMTRNGIPPASVMSYIEVLPSEQQVVAQIDFAADNYYRNNTLLNAMMNANGWNEDDIDNFFIEAAKL